MAIYIVTVKALLANALVSNETLVIATTGKPHLNRHSNFVIKSSRKRLLMQVIVMTQPLLRNTKWSFPWVFKLS